VKVEIRHRWTSEVLFTAEVDDDDPVSLRTAMAHANLAGADLGGAYLAGADLGGAYLAGAYLAQARNLPVGIEPCDPPTPYQCPSRSGSREERARRYRERHPEVPVVDNLDSQILELVTAGAGVLEMSAWHGEGGVCGTTHCRAGWAVHLAGKAGIDLERKLDAHRAGRMIYLASTGRVPWFFASNERALEDIALCAAEEQNAAGETGA